MPNPNLWEDERSRVELNYRARDARLRIEQLELSLVPSSRPRRSWLDRFLGGLRFARLANGSPMVASRALSGESEREFHEPGSQHVVEILRFRQDPLDVVRLDPIDLGDLWECHSIF